jgi:hypothetical protein
MLKMAQEINADEFSLEDDEIIRTILAKLPPEFGPIGTSMENMSNISMEFLIERLVHEESKFKKYQGHSQNYRPKEFARQADERKCFKCDKPGHFKKDCRSKVKCNNCGKDGHITKNCFKKKNSEDKDEESKEEANEANEVNEESETDDTQSKRCDLRTRLRQKSHFCQQDSREWWNNNL